VKLTTTIREELIEKLKIEAIKQKLNVNDILEKLIEKYLNDGVELK
jgi:predicted HicB family RNase H-like nuclease